MYDRHYMSNSLPNIEDNVEDDISDIVRKAGENQVNIFYLFQSLYYLNFLMFVFLNFFSYQLKLFIFC